MSYATSKGYRCERDVRDFLDYHDLHVERPRTTSRPDTDTGDLRGLPLVLSVKDWAASRFGPWVDELALQVDRSPWRTGLVVSRRPRRGVGHMFVTTSLELAVPLLRAYVAQHPYDDLG